jgi:hypothetical protein
MSIFYILVTEKYNAMDNLHIKGSFKSPEINLNYADGVIEIKGRSWPENVLDVYEPAFKWLDEYAKKPQPKTTVKSSLEYFNTSSSKVVLEIIRKIESMHGKGTEVKIEWFYEDDDPDMKEQGEVYKNMVKVPMEIIPVKEFDFVFNKP